MGSALGSLENSNALNFNALSFNALNALQSPSANGAAAREVMRYLVGCALSDGQVFSFSWTDAGGITHAESYQGLIGLAPGWATGPLSNEGAEWVSACIASRSNYYGVPVQISSRGAHHALKDHDNTTSAELATYAHLEGAFWGNLFGAAPYLRGCFKSSNVEYSRSSLRECAAGHVSSDSTIVGCGMVERMGTCLDGSDKGASWTPCKKLVSGDRYKDCKRPDGTTTDSVISTWLP